MNRTKELVKLVNRYIRNREFSEYSIQGAYNKAVEELDARQAKEHTFEIDMTYVSPNTETS